MSAVADDLDKLRVFEPLLTKVLLSAAEAASHPTLAKVEKVVFAKLLKEGILCALKERDSNRVHYRRIPEGVLDKLRKSQEGNQETLEPDLKALALQWVKLHLVFKRGREKGPIKVGDIARLTRSVHRTFQGISKTSTICGPVVGILLFDKQEFAAKQVVETAAKCRAKFDPRKKEYEIPETAFPKLGVQPPMLGKAIQANPRFLRTLVGFEYSYYSVGDLFHPSETGEAAIKFYLGKKLTIEGTEEHKAS